MDAYTGWAKNDTPLVFEFLLLLDAVYLHFFVYWRMAFIKRHRSLSTDANKFCFFLCE